MKLASTGEARGYPDTNWKMNVSNSGDILYCLQKFNNSLMLEAELDSLSKVTMIGSEVRTIGITYQNFEVKYSTDGVIWITYKGGWNLTVRFTFN